MEPALAVRPAEDAAAGIVIRTNPATVDDAISNANARVLRVYTKQDYWSHRAFQRQATQCPLGTKPPFRLVGDALTRDRRDSPVQ